MMGLWVYRSNKKYVIEYGIEQEHHVEFDSLRAFLKMVQDILNVDPSEDVIIV